MSGAPSVFRMRWVDLLFAHWPVPAETLRPLVPPGLELDAFEEQAWLGIVPFRMEDVAPRFLPSPPGPGAFPELNVRTYVRRGGRAGVWFLSLDAASRVAVEGARVAFHLPYFRARMSSVTQDGWIDYRSERVGPAWRRGPAFDARYRPVGPVELAPAGYAGGLPDRSPGAVCPGRCGKAFVGGDPPRPVAPAAGGSRDPDQHDGPGPWDRPAARRALAVVRPTGGRRRVGGRGPSGGVRRSSRWAARTDRDLDGLLGHRDPEVVVAPTGVGDRAGQ